MSAKPGEERMVSERVSRELKELLDYLPRIDVERLRYLLEAYEETEGLPPVVRRARVFEKLCEKKTIFIDENPILGTLTQYKFGVYPIPETTGCKWMEGVDRVPTTRGDAVVTQDEMEWISKAVSFWKGKTVYERTKKIIFERQGVNIGLLQKCGMGTESTTSAFIEGIPDYPVVLRKGLDGLITDIQTRASRLDVGDPDDIEKWHFYQAAAKCLKGMITLSHRYASLARETAEATKDRERKTELERLAAVCEWVPKNPARDFREALQSVWFMMLGVLIETPSVLFAPPSRFTQYMYPFYCLERDAGTLMDEEVIELLHFFFIKINSIGIPQSRHGAAWSSSRIGQHLVLGGLMPDGTDATNELDYLVLEAQRRIRLPEPLVDLVYHDQLPNDFLIKCVDLVKTGIGQPAFHSVEKTIQRHLYHDRMTLEEARDVSVVGCVQSVMPGYSAVPWEGSFNLAKMLELSLNNGVDPLAGVQLGPETGTIESIRSYEDLYNCFVRQAEYFIPLIRTISRTGWNICRDFPVPFESTLVNHCIERGKDLSAGGAKYHAANGTTFVGAIDTANSLAAIKMLVFDDQKITLKHLNKALASDFDGHEDVYRMCIGAPKYGNDDPYVDSIAKGLYEICYDLHQTYPDYLGMPTKPEAYSVTVHWAVGRFTGALPSGRKARTPLTDASVSASPGTDKNGPTSLMRSAAMAIDTVKFGGNHLNMKFHPTALEGMGGANKFISLIKTYFELGGYHVQFNCVSAETLKEAQLHPDKHRNLVVRVAGFSAFFVHLDTSIQNEIMKRTELNFSESS